MSTLIVEELLPDTPITQEFRVERDVSLAYIRPWVYIAGTLADGDLQLEVLEDATVLRTYTINFADINAVKTDAYAHGYLRFDVEPLVLHRDFSELNTAYTLRFTMINHTEDENNYLALVRGWEDPIYEAYGDTTYNTENPFGIEFYEYKE